MRRRRRGESERGGRGGRGCRVTIRKSYGKITVREKNNKVYTFQLSFEMEFSVTLITLIAICAALHAADVNRDALKNGLLERH